MSGTSKPLSARSWRRRAARAALLVLSLAGFAAAAERGVALYRHLDGLPPFVVDQAATRAELAAASAVRITGGFYNARVEALVEAGEIETAESYLAVGAEQGLALEPAVAEKLERARSLPARIGRQVRRAAVGFVTGEGTSLAHLGGAIGADFLLYGDLRDFGKESYHYATGRKVDELLLGLSGIGLAFTAGTYVTAGAAAPLRSGVSVLKLAKRAGVLTRRFGAELGAAVRRALPPEALWRNLGDVRAGEAVRALDVGRLTSETGQALARSVDRAALAKLGTLFDDLAAVRGAAGTPAALRLLKHVETPVDLKKGRAVAEIGGARTLAWEDAFGGGLLDLVKATGKLTVKTVLGAALAVLAALAGLAAAMGALLLDRLAVRPAARRLVLRAAG